MLLVQQIFYHIFYSIIQDFINFFETIIFFGQGCYFFFQTSIFFIISFIPIFMLLYLFYSVSHFQFMLVSFFLHFFKFFCEPTVLIYIFIQQYFDHIIILHTQQIIIILNLLEMASMRDKSSIDPRLLQQKIEFLQDQNRQLQQREKKLKRINQEFTNLFESFQSEATTHKSQSKTLEKKLEHFTNAKLRTQLESKHQQCESLSRTILQNCTKHEQELKQLNSQFNQLQKENEFLKSREIKNEKLKEREHSLKMKEMEITMQKSTYEKLMKQHEETMGDIRKKYDNEIQGLMTQNKQLQQLLEKKQSQYTQFCMYFKLIEAENTELKKSKQKIEKNHLHEIETLKKNHTQQLLKMNNEIERGKHLLKNKENELEGIVKTNSKKISDSKHKNIMLQDAAHSIKFKYQKQNSVILKTLIQKEQEIVSLKKQVNRSRTKLHKLSSFPIQSQNHTTSKRMLHTEGPQIQKYSTAHSTTRVSQSRKETGVCRQLFCSSKQNKKIQFFVEKRSKNF